MSVFFVPLGGNWRSSCALASNAAGASSLMACTVAGKFLARALAKCRGSACAPGWTHTRSLSLHYFLHAGHVAAQGLADLFDGMIAYCSVDGDEFAVIDAVVFQLQAFADD